MDTPESQWPHTELQEILTNLFFVMGTNITHYEGNRLQHSRNMVVVKSGTELSLINTVRLNDKGLVQLEQLGKVANVIRIGAFHGRDDAFYLDRYKAKLWALPDMQHESNKKTDIELIPNGQMPFPNCSVFIFKSSKFPEGILHIDREGGILITCDSVKNWTYIDQFFSVETAKLYQELGFLGTATISKVWQQACQVKAQDFIELKSLTFQHLISAHGEPLLNHAYESLATTIKTEYNL